MARKPSDPTHCWLVWRKAHEAASDYLLRGIAETGISDTDFRILEALLHKGPLPVNTIGPKVNLTPGSISVAVDRLLERDLVTRVESSEDRRVRIVALTKAGKDLIVPIFRKHSAEIGKMVGDATPKELQMLESVLKKTGKRAETLAAEKKSSSVGARDSSTHPPSPKTHAAGSVEKQNPRPSVRRRTQGRTRRTQSLRMSGG